MRVVEKDLVRSWLDVFRKSNASFGNCVSCLDLFLVWFDLIWFHSRCKFISFRTGPHYHITRTNIELSRK